MKIHIGVSDSPFSITFQTHAANCNSFQLYLMAVAIFYKYVLYKESSFKGNYEGIPAVRVEDWVMEKT